jgi:hypothetical protein
VLSQVAVWTPNLPWEIFAKVVGVGAWNAVLIWIGVEEGDIPTS